MTFIPNEADAGIDGEQSELDSVDLDVILDGFRLRGVVSGCAVTAGSNLDTTVAAGSILYDGDTVAVAGGTLSHAAAGAQLRFDLVVADSSGTLSIIDGTAFFDATYGPSLPTYTNKVVLAVVCIPANATSLSSSNITDHRITLSSKWVLKENYEATGDILYASAASTPSRLVIGAANTILLSNGSIPVWTAPSAIAALIDHGLLLGLSDDDHTAYHTDARALTWLGTRSTDDLPEGVTNLYHTPERVMDVVGALLIDSSSINVTYNDAGDSLTIEVIAGGVDHGSLSGLLDDDHTQYRLESEDHTHQSTGLQAGTLDHGLALTGLTDDDHTQYALLAGRSGGQTLIGGTATGDGLTLQMNSAADNGTLTVKGSATTLLTITAPTGQLGLPVAGSSAGVLVGGDAQLYRVAADVWASPDSMRLGGYLYVGSESAPANVTAGDATMTRLAVGSNAAFSVSSGLFAKFAGTTTETTSGAKVMFHFSPTVSPTVDSLSEFRILNMSALASTSDVALGTIHTLYAEIDYRALNPGATGDVTSVLSGLSINPLVLRSINTARQAVTTVRGLQITPYSRPSGTGTVSVTSMFGILITGPSSAGATVTDYYALQVTNPGANFTPTSLIGIDLEKFTRGTTDNIEFRNAGKMVHTPTAQTLAAATDTIVNSARIIELSNSTGASLTLTSAPTISTTGAQDGQIITLVNDDSADNIVLQDESALANSQLRLPGAANLTLGPRDSATFYFNAGAGEWYCIASTNL